MNTIKLTNKELELIKDMLIVYSNEKIRYKGVQKLMVKIQNQLQQQLVYRDTDYGYIFETDEQLVKYLRVLTLDDEYNNCTDEFLIAESLEHNWVEQIKRSELTDTE
jgi:hypothetical protein|tara:strand:- start:673 stop:993 length:321 start_codon:yes stop_codon:yes gene_type:complete